MLDTTESLSAMAAYDPREGETRPTAAQAMVPMLDWPTDLFNTFTAEIDDKYD
jgi:hypothetical protein